MSQRIQTNGESFPAPRGIAGALVRFGVESAVELWRDPGGLGTPAFSGEDGRFAWLWVSAEVPPPFSLAFCERLFTDPTGLGRLDGPFALVIIRRGPNKRLLAATDQLGIQGVHYAWQDGSWLLSTSLAWLLKTLHHDGNVKEKQFQEHFLFGYSTSEDRQVYRGVHTIAPGCCLVLEGRKRAERRYWTAPEPHRDIEEDDVECLGTSLARSAASGFMALTAGKDSLCLAAVVASQRRRSGTFGVSGCADQLQGRQVAEALGWSHVSASVCDEREFTTWSDWIAVHSAGLATTSYVDMACFVGRSIPGTDLFLMAEGGECVRDFFAARAVSNYLTAAASLRRTLRRVGLGHVPRQNPLSLLKFYRERRMPGNFSLRHAVLSPLRGKRSPFLSSAFLDRAHSLSLTCYRGSQLHRQIVSRFCPRLLPFFDHPTTTKRSTQEWPARIGGRLGAILGERLAEALGYCGDVFDPPKVMAFCRKVCSTPSRDLFHLLRLYSFARFRTLLRRDGLEGVGHPTA